MVSNELVCSSTKSSQQSRNNALSSLQSRLAWPACIVNLSFMQFTNWFKCLPFLILAIHSCSWCFSKQAHPGTTNHNSVSASSSSMAANTIGGIAGQSNAGCLNSSSNPRTTGPVNGDECYFWRTTGCQFTGTCRYKHIPDHKGIDRKPWHKSKWMISGDLDPRLKKWCHLGIRQIFSQYRYLSNQ